MHIRKDKWSVYGFGPNGETGLAYAKQYYSEEAAVAAVLKLVENPEPGVEYYIHYYHPRDGQELFVNQYGKGTTYDIEGVAWN